MLKIKPAKKNKIDKNQCILIGSKTTQQTLNVDSTLKYVEITSWRRSTWYPRWFNVDLWTLIQRWNLTLKRWFCVESKSNFVLMSWYLKNCNFYINAEKIIVLQRRNNVTLSTLNQRWNLTLKQRWFWVTLK